MARGSARRRHRAPLPGLRPPRPSRSAPARAPPRRLRDPRRPGAEYRDRASLGPGGVTTAPNGNGAPETGSSAAAVLRNRSFLLLWLSQVSTQLGVNMVLYA